jgi:hypothetical protein
MPPWSELEEYPLSAKKCAVERAHEMSLQKINNWEEKVEVLEVEEEDDDDDMGDAGSAGASSTSLETAADPRGIPSSSSNRFNASCFAVGSPPTRRKRWRRVGGEERALEGEISWKVLARKEDVGKSAWSLRGVL